MQRTPQAPQLSLSLEGVTQLAPQRICPIAQTVEQTPTLHTWPAAQTFPQLPQWVALLCVLTQVPPHKASPASQTHWPATQEVPAVHATPHIPQFWLLLRRSMQAPLQAVSG